MGREMGIVLGLIHFLIITVDLVEFLPKVTGSIPASAADILLRFYGFIQYLQDNTVIVTRGHSFVSCQLLDSS